jgi:hypothetical protein
MRRNFKNVELHEVDPDMFWSCVDIAGQDECWLWGAAIQDGGYGTLYVMGKVFLSHRISWALQHGRTPEKGQVVRHGCDNPPCVNPMHLHIGTQGDHNRDISRRARRKQFNTLAIARALIDGATVEDLVDIFGMSLDWAREYVKLGPEAVLERRALRGVRMPRSRDRRMAPHQPAAVEAARGGMKVPELMERFMLSRATAYRYAARARQETQSSPGE